MAINSLGPTNTEYVQENITLTIKGVVNHEVGVTVFFVPSGFETVYVDDELMLVKSNKDENDRT